jgi:hypothetical protein
MIHRSIRHSQIGTTPVTITVTDAAGNQNTCTLNVTVLEYESPTGTPALACNDEINISLGPDCEAEIVADILLEGDQYGCYDDFDITLTDGYGGPVIPTSPVVTLDQVGQTVVATICDPVTGDCCSTLINVEFYTTPEFICPPDTTVACNAMTDPTFLGEPIITSCIPGGGIISFVDAIQDNGDCGDPRAVITRTWTVADNQGNAETCVQTIEIDAFDLDQVVFPDNYDNLTLPALSCSDVLAMPSLTHPDNTGYPTIGDTDLFEVNYCQSSYSYTDEIFDICPGSYEILRTWKVRNTCLPIVAGDNPREFVQVIQVLDTEGPQIDCPEPINISTGPFDCTAALSVPLPTIIDACSGTTFTVNASDGALTFQNGIYFLSNLPLGTHTISYTATDECLRSSTCSVAVTVFDGIEPIAICNEDLNISIGGSGYAEVSAADIDEGSYDNCGPVRLEVRRLIERDPATCEDIPSFYSDWSDIVSFSCCDVNQMVTIELRVWDDANQDGIIGGPGDQFNVCWMETLVEDKILPVCQAPPNAVIDCDTVPYDFDPTDLGQLQQLFGEAQAFDNCNADWEELPAIEQLNDCGAGQLIRRFRAVDDFGNVSTNNCQQLIFFQPVFNYEIKFPKDASANCSIPVVDTVEVNEIGCDLLAVSVDDTPFAASGDECYKIFRRYQVINWCEYDGQSDPVVVSRDEDCDDNPGDEDVWVLVRPNGVVYFDRDNDENNQNPSAFLKSEQCDGLTNPTGHWLSTFFDQNATRDPITGADDPVGTGEGDPNDQVRNITSNGFWQYTQIISVYDDTEPALSFTATDPFCSLDNGDCDATVTVTFSVEEACTPDDLTFQVALDLFEDGLPDTVLTNSAVLSGTYPDYSLTGTFPLGEHAYIVSVSDGCGNDNVIAIPFSVVDCKAPNPVCTSGLAVELMPVVPAEDLDGDGDLDSGGATVWASDFISSPLSDCTGPVTYSINRVGETPDMDQASLTLTCDDLGNVVLEIYGWDAANNPYAMQPDSTMGGPNYDFCETFIIVQDNMFDVCNGSTGTASIAGLIYTEEDEMVADVEVTLSGGMDQNMITGNDGAYDFSALMVGEDYTITPLHDADADNGVSTFDLILIQRHILSVTPLDSPYKMIAADIDNSGNITVIDLIEMRKLILSIYSDYPNNTSWRFIDADYVFPDPANPWLEPFPEVINFNNLPEGLMADTDFIAVKIGDVNSDATTNNLQTIEDRNFDNWYLDVEDRILQPGEMDTLRLTTEQLSQLAGMQFTLDVDPTRLEILGVEEGVVRQNQMAWHRMEEGLLMVSWNAEQGQSLSTSKADELLAVIVKAKVATWISDALSFETEPTYTEAYHKDGRLFDLNLAFFENGETAGFALYQNQPNPFEQQTAIRFTLPKAMEAELIISTIDGKLVRRIKDDFEAGTNEVLLDLEQVERTGEGILLYTLKASDFTATRRMVWLRK